VHEIKNRQQWDTMRTYIYALFDPRKPEVYTYIGQTTQLHSRVNCHARCKDRATKSWASALALDGIPVGHKVLQEVESGGLEAESRFISELRPQLNTAVSTNYNFQINPIISLSELEGRYIRWTMEFFANNKVATAKALGIGRQTLYNKLKAHGIE